MRLKTEIIIAAEVKRAQSLGLFAALIKKGDETAGQIYVIICRNNTDFLLIGPALGQTINDDGQRVWQYPLGDDILCQDKVNNYLDKIMNFDCDIYILEVEDRDLEFRPMGVYGGVKGHQEDKLKLAADSIFKR